MPHNKLELCVLFDKLKNKTFFGLLDKRTYWEEYLIVFDKFVIWLGYIVNYNEGLISYFHAYKNTPKHNVNS